MPEHLPVLSSQLGKVTIYYRFPEVFRIFVPELL